MCYAGAKSETAQQLKELLHLQKLTDEDILKMNSELVTCINTRLGKDVALNTANKLYPNKGFALEKSFIDTVTKNFHGDVEQVDFSNSAAASKTINDWVLSKTNNKIENLIPESSIDPLLRLVLVNAIYFKGNWLEKFDPAKTTKEDFNCADGTKVKVEMMKLSKKFRILDNVLGNL
jgi:serpin B